uniref:Glycosyltransferase 2-like domain-containing protein n=1 Tax=viral metagenome TaxID=1070528 RepID=A0A6C0CIF6_9ZZZZ
MKIFAYTYDLQTIGGARNALIGLCDKLSATSDVVDIRMGGTLPDPNSEDSWVPDLIITQQHSIPKGHEYANKHNIPIIVYVHGPNQIVDGKTYDLVLCCSDEQAALIKDKNPDQRTLVYHPSVSFERCYSNPMKYTELADEQKKITLIGTEELKGHDIFVKIAERLPDEQFMIVGDGLSSFLDVANLPKNIELMPRTEEVAKVYQKTKILVMPSKWDACPMVPVEANFNNIPVVAHDLPGIREALFDHGWFVDNREDVDEWVEMIKQITLGNDSEVENLRVKHQSRNQKETAELVEFINGLYPNYSALDSAKVTFIIKTFERPECLRALLGDIERYYPQIKTLVVDDSLEDSLIDTEVKALEARADSKYFRLPFDSGLSKGRNQALEQVTTPYFVILDDDFRFYYKTDLIKFQTIMDRGDCVIIGGDVKDYQKYNGRLDLQDGVLRYVPRCDLRGSEYQCDIVFNFFMGDTQAIREFGGWDPDLKICEHTDFFLRLKDARAGRVLYTSEVSVVNSNPYNEKDTSTLSPRYKKFRSRKSFEQMWHEKHDIEVSIAFNGFVKTHIDPDDMSTYSKAVVEYMSEAQKLRSKRKLGASFTIDELNMALTNQLVAQNAGVKYTDIVSEVLEICKRQKLFSLGYMVMCNYVVLDNTPVKHSRFSYKFPHLDYTFIDNMSLFCHIFERYRWSYEACKYLVDSDTHGLVDIPRVSKNLQMVMTKFGDCDLESD